jgi:hypothetical protein
MSEYAKTVCPECGSSNGPGAPFCAGCGMTLLRAGFAARPVDDHRDDDRPRVPKKKPAPDTMKKGLPPPKKKPPVDEDEDEEERRPVKKKVRRRDEDEEEPEQEEEGSLRESTMLNLLAPVGGSVWGLGSLLFGVFGALLPVVLYILYQLWNAKNWLGKIGYAGVVLAAFMAFLALPLGGLSFIFRPKKGTYGGVTSYMRAIIGMLAGLVGLVLSGVVGYAIYGFLK